MQNYSADRFYVIAYDIPQGAMGTCVDIAVKRNIGYMYFTELGASYVGEFCVLCVVYVVLCVVYVVCLLCMLSCVCLCCVCLARCLVWCSQFYADLPNPYGHITAMWGDLVRFAHTADDLTVCAQVAAIEAANK